MESDYMRWYTPREQQDAIRRQREQMEALAKLQEDQKLKLEREEMIRIQQEKLSKLAPWAKKETSPLKEMSQGPTLQEIQRLEAERERKERQAREMQVILASHWSIPLILSSHWSVDSTTPVAPTVRWSGTRRDKLRSVSSKLAFIKMCFLLECCGNQKY